MQIQLEEFSYPDQLKEQRELFIECFPENKGTPVETEEHYKWKFKSFPSQKLAPSYEYIARLNGEIIGYYASIPYVYNIEGKLKNAAMVCDVMTGVKARGKGVFTKLGIYSTEQFKNQGLAFSTGYPIRPEVIPGHKKAGWYFPFQIPMYGKFLKLNAFLKTKNKAFLVPLANLFLNIYNGILNLSSFNQKNKNIITESYISTQISKIKGIDEFFMEWIKENPVALNKNKHFLRWRLGAPEKQYQLVVLRNKDNHKIIAYTVFRKVEKESVPCIGILDFSFLDKYKKWSGLLLKQIEEKAKKENAELILMMMMKASAKKYKIKSNGFIKTPFPFSFIIKQFDDSIDPGFLKNERNWNLMWIDSDDL